MPDGDNLRHQLRLLGDRRATLKRETEELARDTAAAIQNARGKISMTEVAELIGFDRTAIYRTYGGAPTGQL